MISDVMTEATEKMAKAVDVAKDDFATVRTGRINAALFQKIPVEYYGSPTPLAQLASLQTPEARTLIVTPYDKTALKEIERAIATFPNLGASPTNDGEIVRVTIPEALGGTPQGVREDRPWQGRGPQGRAAQHPPPGEGRPRRAEGRGVRRRHRPQRQGASTRSRRSTSTRSTTR